MANPNPRTDHLEPTRFPPCKSGNPSGRPRRSQRKKDRRLIRAIREGWGIPADKLAPVIERLLKIATGELTADKDATSAARALIMAQRLQLATLTTQIKLEEHHELEEQLRRLEGADGDSNPAPPV